MNKEEILKALYISMLIIIGATLIAFDCYLIGIITILIAIYNIYVIISKAFEWDLSVQEFWRDYYNPNSDVVCAI